jgi:hypothetical protein
MASALHAVDLSTGPDTKVSGLIPIRGRRENLSIAEEAVVREAEGIEGLDYVFFRRFADERSSQVAAYVIDNGDERHTESDLAQIHLQVWLNGEAPLLYVGWPTRVDVLSCAGEPVFWRNNACQYHPAAKISVEQEELKGLVLTSSSVSHALEDRRRFSALRLSDGTFWEDPRNFSLAHADRAAHRRLIDAVVETDQDIGGEKHPVLRRLLLLMILVKYLEDRRVFPNDGWFGQFHKGANSFFEVLQNGTPKEVRELLARLERKFNGDVFSLPEDRTHTLTTKELRRFAALVETRTLQQQRYLWEQYSFRHLPVEVLGHLYQRFAQRGKGAIYTPPFVAGLLLDYALPYGHMSGSERILDPTCGSGVFLVGAFRRLVNYWRSLHQWRQPDVPTLKTILKRSLFGVELQGEALNLAAFNLALAICDALMPNVIWNELRFDRLRGTNLIEGDFFEFMEKEQTRFDVVVGNPPFMSQLTDAAARVNRKAEAVRGSLPDKQIAYLIAEQAMTLLRADGRMCLIQPASLLYNEKARSFQRHFLSTHQTDYVLDFTSIRGLFDKADTKIAALVTRKTDPPTKHRIVHLTLRRTFSVDEQIGFELDHYDRHVIPQEQAVAVPHTWKVNLLGGGRLHHLAARLRDMGTLADYVAANEWDAGEGFIVGKSCKRELTPWLTGKTYLPSMGLTEDGVERSQLSKVKDKLFAAPRTESRYQPPLMLIRENEKLPCAFWDRGFLAYKAKIVGVHAPRSQRAALREFYGQFRKALPALRAFCLMESTQLLVGRATAPLKRDIDNLPWPKVGESWDLTSWEKILCDDLVEYMAGYVRLGQDSELLTQQVTDTDIKQYTRCFCDMLGSVYGNLKIGRSLVLNGLACQAFYFGEEPDLDWPNDWTEPLQQLVYVQCGETLRTARVIRFYLSNVLLIVKPDRLRYWIRSTAIRDADETLTDLRKQGY